MFTVVSILMKYCFISPDDYTCPKIREVVNSVSSGSKDNMVAYYDPLSNSRSSS